MLPWEIYGEREGGRTMRRSMVGLVDGGVVVGRGRLRVAREVGVAALVAVMRAVSVAHVIGTVITYNNPQPSLALTSPGSNMYVLLNTVQIKQIRHTLMATMIHCRCRDHPTCPSNPASWPRDRSQRRLHVRLTRVLRPLDEGLDGR